MERMRFYWALAIWKASASWHQNGYVLI